MTRAIFFRTLTIFLIAAMTWQPVVAWAGDSYEEINELAQNDMKSLEEGIINVEKFCGSPWYKRHMGKLIAGGAIVIGGVAIFCTGGLATAPVAAGASHFVATGAAAGISGLSAASAAVTTAGAGVYIDSKGDIKIPEDKKEDVYNFYKENYRSWVSRSSTKQEFGETAIAEIVKFLERK